MTIADKTTALMASVAMTILTMSMVLLPTL